MIERIVKLAIDPNSEQGTAFRMIFAESKNNIAEQPGCHGVQLLRVKDISLRSVIGRVRPI